MNRENMSTKVRQSRDDRLYSEAIRNNKSSTNNNNNENRNNEEKTNEESFSSAWNSFKNFCKGIDFGRIIKIFKSTASKFKSCNDGISKISCLIEGLIELFD